MGNTLSIIADILGIVGGCFAGVAVLYKATTTDRANIFWGNIKRVAFHKIQFSHGWGHHGRVTYRAVNNQSLWSKRRPRFRKFLSKLEPDYVIVTVPDEAQISGPLAFTEMRILWSKMGAQLEFTCAFREAVIQREHFLAIGFHVAGMDHLATSWSMSHEAREGWEISAESSQIQVSLSESGRILRTLPDTGMLKVDVWGFRRGVGATVGMFDLSRALNTPIEPWAQYFTTRDSFNAHIRRDEPTSYDEVFSYVFRKSSAEGGIGEPPPERVVALGPGTGRRILAAESDTKGSADMA